MKITAVEALHLRLPEVREVADGSQDCLSVRVHTDAGLTGLGEVVSCSYVARAVVEAPRSAPFRHGLNEIAKGLDPLDTAAAQQAMTEGTLWYGPGGVARHCISGVDMALWDIKGKAANKPVRQLLATDPVDQLPCYASVLWPENPALVAESARQFLAGGYRAVKYGWAPLGQDPALDEALEMLDFLYRVEYGNHDDGETHAAELESLGTVLSQVARGESLFVLFATVADTDVVPSLLGIDEDRVRAVSPDRCRRRYRPDWWRDNDQHGRGD